VIAPVKTRNITTPASAVTSPAVPTAHEEVDTTTPLAVSSPLVRIWSPIRYCSSVNGTTTTAAMANRVRQWRRYSCQAVLRISPIPIRRGNAAPPGCPIASLMSGLLPSQNRAGCLPERPSIHTRNRQEGNQRSPYNLKGVTP